MDKITKKYIFEQKLKGEPIQIPFSKTPWLAQIKNLDILIECGILEEGEGGKGRFWVRYPILFHGTDHPALDDKWHTLGRGHRLAEPGDLWEISEE